MKKIFTTTLLALIALSSFAATKRIAYVSDTTRIRDAVVRNALTNAGYTIVNVLGSLDTASVRAACQADTIDMVLVAEPVGSTATGMLGLEGVKKPLLNMKAFAYKKATKAWSWAATQLWNDSTIKSIDVVSGQSSHSIFTGLGSSISVLDSVISSKGLEYVNFTSATLQSGTLTQLATLTGTSKPSIFEIAAGSTVKDLTTSKTYTIPQKFINFGINTLSQKRITANGAKLIVNICDYLTTTTPTNIKTISSESAFKAIASAGSLSVQVPTSGTVKVISISGALVAQKVVSSEASFSLPQGTYVVQYTSGASTTAKTVIVK